MSPGLPASGLDCPPNGSSVIPNGACDRGNVQPRQPIGTSLAINPTPPCPLCIRRPVGGAQLDQKRERRQLIELFFPELLARLPRHDLLLVGEGPVKARLQRRIDELRMADRVQMAGWRDDLPSILALAELLLVPSRWEGMPNVVLEAMASSRSVVAMQAGGIEELLGHQPAADRGGGRLADVHQPRAANSPVMNWGEGWGENRARFRAVRFAANDPAV